MSASRTVTLPLNRVEGDLEVTVEVRDGVVADARCAGTLYRGFEGLLVGRVATDSLVVTPRICGICGVAHSTAAVLALEAACGAEPPPAAVALRNVGLAVEHLQSDLRQHVLMFCADLVHPVFAARPWHAAAVERYRTLAGSSALRVVDGTRRAVEISALIGGQWPHSPYMVPGGLASAPTALDLTTCRQLLGDTRRWYEDLVLGCDLDTWSAVESRADLDAWLAASPRHRAGELGFFLTVAADLGLEQLGRGHDGLLSFAAFPDPDSAEPLIAGGWWQAGTLAPLDAAAISEDLSHTWYEGPVVSHPRDGATVPGSGGGRVDPYSWAKAPRYQGQPAETGALAQLAAAGHPLISDLLAAQPATAFTRQLARLVRSATLLPLMSGWLDRLSGKEVCYRRPPELRCGRSSGLTAAPRGALGHWLELDQGIITRYQVVTPTAWNASPRDRDGRRGPIEEALVGTPVADPDDPVLVGLVVRSFDPCLVCAVHLLDATGRRRTAARRAHPVRSGRWP